MPGEFLTKEQRELYANYNGIPSSSQLAQYFYLDELDLRLIQKQHGEVNRFGFALQVCTVKFLGTFIPDILEIPQSVVYYVADQLSIPDPMSFLSAYSNDRNRWKHSKVIAYFYGYKEFYSPPVYFRLLRWLERFSVG